jgi:hypothetical protein
MHATPPPWLKLPGNSSHAEVTGSAVAVMRNDDLSRHAGLLLERPDNGPEMLHLCWHHALWSDEPGRDVAWVQLQLQPYRHDSVAALARLVQRRFGPGTPRDKRIPYALKYQGAYFRRTKDNVDLILLGGKGLSCSTFVLAVLRGAKVDLVKHHEWVGTRPGDQEIYDKVVASMREGPARVPPEHLALVEADGPSPRIRPEEVGGAASFPPARLPVGLADAEAAGFEVVASLDQDDQDELMEEIDSGRGSGDEHRAALLPFLQARLAAHDLPAVDVLLERLTNCVYLDVFVLLEAAKATHSFKARLHAWHALYDKVAFILPSRCETDDEFDAILKESFPSRATPALAADDAEDADD